MKKLILFILLVPLIATAQPTRILNDNTLVKAGDVGTIFKNVKKPGTDSIFAYKIYPKATGGFDTVQADFRYVSPSKTSQLNNDAAFITRTLIDSLGAAQNAALALAKDSARMGRDSVLYTQKILNGVSNFATNSDYSVFGTSEKGLGSLTLPANYFKVGKTLLLTVSGTYQTPLTPGAVTVKLKLGTVTLAQVSVAASVLATSSTVNSVWGDAKITCYSTGTSGTFVAEGFLTFQTAAAAAVTVAFSTAATYNNAGTTQTVNTTIAQKLDVTAAWNTSNTSQGTTITSVVLKANN